MIKVNGILEDLNSGEYENFFGEEAEVAEKEEGIIDLVDAALVDEEGVENKPEAASQEDREVAEDVLQKDSEVKEKVFQSAQWEVVSQYPSGLEEARRETVPGKEMEEAAGEEPEPSIDLEEQIKLDEGLKEILSEEDTGKLKEPLLEEAVEKQIPDKEKAAEDPFTEKESLMEQDERSLQIASAFARFVKTGEESLIENFSREEIEKTLLRHHTEKGHPIYEAMEKKVAQLKETERYKIKAAEQKWENRIVGFISGLTAALIVVLLRKYLFSL